MSSFLLRQAVAAAKAGNKTEAVRLAREVMATILSLSDVLGALSGKPPEAEPMPVHKDTAKSIDWLERAIEEYDQHGRGNEDVRYNIARAIENLG